MPNPEHSFKSYEGCLSSEFTESVTEPRIHDFCVAVGAEPALIAPPTFLTIFRAGEFQLFEKMGLKLSDVLHGEQQYSYFSEIRAGDDVSFRTRLNTVLEKRGKSRMWFLVFGTEFTVRSEKAALAKTTVVVREST